MPLLLSACVAQKPYLQTPQGELNELLHEWEKMAIQDHRDIIIWVYLPITHHSDAYKEDMLIRIEETWAELHQQLQRNASIIKTKQWTLLYEEALSLQAKLHTKYSYITSSLVDYEDYENPIKMFEAEDRIISDIDEPSKELIYCIVQLRMAAQNPDIWQD